ncbi:hypothetical protein Rhe02_89540 [Rhizocola hellebori]|uniref:JAB-N domain-containing protein n=1 Tax=Rhizocola hellebori TaxID=1392758 RepID=A0A8J3VLP2_9ACTN|nr:JAB N-terminal domain-containing protein [Rhizocola hellebori]GIH10887.1 hypothetical protein Rhe02_89540 [Rhizocola hellebori]
MSQPPVQNDVWVELYKGESLTLHSRLPLADLVYVGLLEEMGLSAKTLNYRVVAVNIADEQELTGEPELINVRHDFGHLIISGSQANGIPYKRWFPIRELLAPTVRKIAHELDPVEKLWGYCLASPVISQFPIARPVPVVQGTMEIHTGDTTQSRFRVKRSVEPTLPEFDLDELGREGKTLAGTGVILTEATHKLLSETLPLSDRMEVGGFLSGKAFRSSRPGAHLLLIQSVLPAQHAGASGMQFTFTGDSFREMNSKLDTMDGQRLLGWYHTHLFPATDQMGLSMTDVGLHFRTFQQPWQVAGLINYYGVRRVLRFYVRDGEEMSECPQWIIDDRGRYRNAGNALGA